MAQLQRNTLKIKPQNTNLSFDKIRNNKFEKFQVQDVRSLNLTIFSNGSCTNEIA